ncbi:MAG TPA: glycoside hydrolase family protein [Opitutaceae bacterium]|nr:glycoside hydrolase family protein [Opitutaceae bacterium]
MRARGFGYRLGAARRNSGLVVPGHWVWCGSIVADPAAGYHMFASIWEQSVPFHPFWVSHSRIVRAFAPRIEDPFVIEEEVLPPRSPACWDGRATHNPTVVSHGGRYYLYYTGITYPEPFPDPSDGSSPFFRSQTARRSQRIGVAVASHPRGPWRRPAAPLLEPRPGRWDALMTTNAAPCAAGEGRFLLAYKSSPAPRGLLMYGMTCGPGPEGPFARISDQPIFDFYAHGNHSEDACIWRGRDGLEMLMKDMTGGLCGEAGAGIHATSEDGVKWNVSPGIAFPRQLDWTDGTRSHPGCLERPQIVLHDGRPSHLVLAMTDGPETILNARHTRNVVVPLLPTTNA